MFSIIDGPPLVLEGSGHMTHNDAEDQVVAQVDAPRGSVVADKPKNDLLCRTLSKFSTP